MHYLNAPMGDPVSRDFVKAMRELASEDLPCGWDAIENAPDTLEDLVAYYGATGRIAVERSGSTGTLMGTPEDHYMFRAWHDLTHATKPGPCPFTLPGELAAWGYHRNRVFEKWGDNYVTRHFGDLMGVEFIHQNVFYQQFGEYPDPIREWSDAFRRDHGIIQPYGVN